MMRTPKRAISLIASRRQTWRNCGRVVDRNSFAAMKTNWRAAADGNHIDIEWRNGSVYLEDGPSAWPNRGHEGTGGTISLRVVRNRGREMYSRYDGLYERLLADLAPAYRVIDALRGVVVTMDDDLQPSPTPCRLAIDGQRLYVYPATSEPCEHLTASPNVSLLVMAPDDDQSGDASWWCQIRGPARIVEVEVTPNEHPNWEVELAAELFAEKYDGVAPNDVPTIRIDIEQWTAHTADDSLPA